MIALIVTKKNLYKISRGNIGDALKEVLCIPYALARDDLDIEWNEPLVIDSGKISYYIRPNFDRVGQEAETFIEEHENKIEDVTSITIRYHPEMIYNKKVTIYNFIFNYTMLNTHITFNVEIFLDDPIAKMQGTIPHIQRINPNWRNPPSIKFYSLREFQDYIKYLEDKNMKAYSVIRRFREGTNLKMDKLPMTVGELQKDDQKISELYD